MNLHFANIELKIVKTNPHLSDSWYQTMLHIGEQRYPIGWSHVDYMDCISEAEEIVKKFSEQKIPLMHGGIYDYL